MSTDKSSIALPVPGYILDHDDPAALFSRMQRLVIHLELLQTEAVREFDISFRDFVILATLLKEPAPHELPVTQLANYVLRPMGSISQGLSRIEERGLITRSIAPDDRRKVLVRLTKQGARLCDEVHATYDETRQGIFDRLNKAQIKRIDGAITELVDALDANYIDNEVSNGK